VLDGDTSRVSVQSEAPDSCTDLSLTLQCILKLTHHGQHVTRGLMSMIAKLLSTGTITHTDTHSPNALHGL